MKKQILTLIIGILIGAVVTATIFLIFKPGSKSRPDFGGNRPSNGERQFPGEKGDLPEGFEVPEGFERPERPNKDSKSESSNNNGNTVKENTN